MSTCIRLSRCGSKKKAFYRIVVADSRSPRDGKFIENVGTFDPGSALPLSLDLERYQYWTGEGAQPSDTVLRALARSGMVLANNA